MSQQELLRRVVESLEGAGIEYMLTGSVVSSLQGEPRATHDIDIVIAVPTSAASAAAIFKAAFPEPDFYLDELATALSGGSEKQFIDALRVYEVQYEHLDPAYLDTWATELGVTQLLARLRAEAEPLD